MIGAIVHDRLPARNTADPPFMYAAAAFITDDLCNRGVLISSLLNSGFLSKRAGGGNTGIGDSLSRILFSLTEAWLAV
jgi:hypothetical protein